VVAGPTAVGKSSAALALARRVYRGAVISMDSLQVCRELDIGTDKVSLRERQQVCTHMHMSSYTHIYSYTHTYIHTPTSTHTHTHIHTYTYTHTHTYVPAHANVRTLTHVRTYTRTHTYDHYPYRMKCSLYTLLHRSLCSTQRSFVCVLCVCVCVCVCVDVCMCVCRSLII
jgi:Isopentenyl transferase